MWCGGARKYGTSSSKWDIHYAYPWGDMPMLTRTTLFLSNRSQAVRLPKMVAFGEQVRDVVIVSEGSRRIIAPADAAWDDFFAAPGVNLGERNQPTTQEREAL
ncbi:MAG: type II toxin-antitoxin system VapB family antitoxin [Acetobacter sp.]